MRMKRASAKVLSFVLALCMVIGILPTSGFAAQETSTDRTAANVDIIQSYSAQMREANTKTDYSTGGFRWDTEGKTDSWRYFNGVMLDAFLMEGDVTYADAFYNSNINDDGTPKNYHIGELDSVPTARGLFDLLDSSANAEKYKKAIQYVYTQLEGQVTYSACGGNYLHKQDTNGNPTSGWETWNIGLDGLYMAEPFLMECANAIDNGKLSLTDQSGKAVASADIYKAVYDRFAWVAETMYDETTGLYNHGWNVSKNKGNGHFWGRGIGWYAMALVDTIDMMPATYQTQMQPYLTKLFDGMLKYQDTDTGMWYNVVNRGTDLSKNILETSVSSMMAYSLMKAYIKGYVTDAKYGQAGLAAFNGVVANKVTGSEGSYAVKDTYLKSGVGTSDSYYTANGYTVDEAKGTGALIMAATQANAAAEKLNETNEPEQPTAPESVTDETTSVTVSGTTATAIQVADKSDDDTVKTALADKLESGFKAYDITLTGYAEGTEATVTMPAPAGADKVYYVAENGTLEEITGATFGDGTVTFTTTHFSTYAAGTGSRAADSGVTIEGNPYEGLEEATEYPEYPADGAVRIDKTATGQNFNSTGVVQVELDTAGISVKQGVDVVLVVDVSNSMGWTDNWFEGMSEDEIKKAKDDVKIPKDSASETTDKLDQAMEAAQEFSSILLADNVKGASTNNSISFVTFAGYDADNSGDEKDKDAHPKLIDSVQTVFTDVQDANSANNAFANTKFTNYTVTGTSVAYDLQIGDTNGSVKASGRNRGNTNYDYAFAQANAAVNELKQKYTGGVQAYEASGRETVVVFMTDGAPSHYNNNRLNGSRKDYQYDTKTVYESVGAYNGDGEDSAGTWLEFITKPNTYAQTLNGNINDFYAVGFDLNHGGFGDFSWTQEELKPVLEGLAGENSVEVELAENGTALQEFYKSLATQIKYAGTNAQVTDTVDSNFTLQTTSFGTTLQTTSFGTDTQTPSEITVTAYDLYTKAETSDNSLIGTRKGTSTTLETVTFNENGTEAYSDQLGTNNNIMTTDADGSVTIAAQYFTYTKDAAGVEKFVWNIGDITDKEVALSYYAYLKGSMEGTCAEGVYYTNESATLEYVDINGKYATKEFPKPAVAWGGASTSFEYYLVNYKGEPVNRAGQVVPFANRIVLYGDTVALNLNQDVTIPAQSINAADYLPEGYFLYDVNASYTVNTASSSELERGITVSDPSEDAKKTTGEGSAQVTQTGAQTTIVVSPADTPEETYIQSRVAFGVRWDLTPIILEYELVKDQIVMDYGKAIQTNVLKNDTTIPNGYTGTLAGFTAYNAKTNLKQAQQSAGSTEYTTANGTYTIVNDKVNFQLKGMLSQVEKVFCVVKVTKNDDTSNYYYLYEELDIIPATVMLYETDFADGVFTLTDGTDKKWSTKQDTADTDAKDEVQNDGTIGVNQTYGFDSTYTDDAIYSNGTSLMVEGEKNSDKVVTTTASFDFTGTGFDLISRTGAQQGMIQVKIFAGSATEPTKTVKVLNKSESELELYQIPVVSVNDLAYGSYHVTVEAYEEINSYAGNMASLNRGGEFYFDAVRVFNPIDVSGENLTGDAVIAQSAYTADGEQNADIFEIRQKIVDKQTYDDESGVVENSVVFVDRTAEGVEVADYTTIGPNNEVYLSKDQGIAFKLTSTEVPASIDIGAKSADGKAVTLSASLCSMDDSHSTSISEDITSCTAQFYNLMAGSNVTTSAILSGGGAYVAIFNDGDGILSVTDFKVAYGDEPGVASISVTPEAVNAVNKIGTAPESEPNYDILSASFDTETCKLRRNATMTVVTTDDVKSLKVTNKKGKEVSADVTSATENGQTTWKVSIKMTNAGKQTYTVTGYSLNGTAGAPASATINVTRK